MLNGREDVISVSFSDVGGGGAILRTSGAPIDSFQKMKEGNKIFIEFFFQLSESSAA